MDCNLENFLPTWNITISALLIRGPACPVTSQEYPLGFEMRVSDGIKVD